MKCNVRSDSVHCLRLFMLIFCHHGIQIPAQERLKVIATKECSKMVSENLNISLTQVSFSFPSYFFYGVNFFHIPTHDRKYLLEGKKRGFFLTIFAQDKI